MSESRFVSLMTFTLAFSLAASQTARPEEQCPTKCASGCCANCCSDDCSTAIYSLSWAADAELGQWIADTVCEVIAPGTWKGQNVLRYQPAHGIMVVHHSAVVQGKVDRFLKKMKESIAAKSPEKAGTARADIHDDAVAPATYRAPNVLNVPDPGKQPAPVYPVPAPRRSPKHLFHFIIRYEGDGLIDDNVVQAMKTQFGSAMAGAAPTASTNVASSDQAQAPGPLVASPPLALTAPAAKQPSTATSSKAEKTP